MKPLHTDCAILIFVLCFQNLREEELIGTEKFCSLECQVTNAAMEEAAAHHPPTYSMVESQPTFQFHVHITVVSN